jgi:hypothetical protein
MDPGAETVPEDQMPPEPPPEPAEPPSADVQAYPILARFDYEELPEAVQKVCESFADLAYDVASDFVEQVKPEITQALESLHVARDKYITAKGA